MKDDSAYRSLTPKPGWLHKSCERCNRDFWLTPAQFRNGIRYCTSTCRYEAPEKVIERTTTKGPGENDCWISSLTPTSPYPLIKTNRETLRAARVVLEKSLGRPIGDNLQALHECNNPRCVRVGAGHIYEGTQKENIQWCVKSGRLDDRKGAKSPTAKLSEEQARDIKFNPDGLSGKELTVRHNISKSQVSGIQHGRMWRDLSP